MYGNGGVLYGWKTIISVHDSLFFNNSVAGSGGAIYAESSIVNISRSRFNVNEASVFGGALYINKVVLTIEECKFSKNAAIDKGKETTVTMSGCKFIKNITAEPGNDSINIKCPHHCLMSAGFGGAIAGIASAISFNKNIKLEQNVATFGGTIYISESGLSIYTEAIIIDNVAAHSGGALFLDSSNIVCLKDVHWS